MKETKLISSNEKIELTEEEKEDLKKSQSMKRFGVIAFVIVPILIGIILMIVSRIIN